MRHDQRLSMFYFVLDNIDMNITNHFYTNVLNYIRGSQIKYEDMIESEAMKPEFAYDPCMPI